MADVDFATCERPDELIRLAWTAGYDRKAVIRAGADAAMLLLADAHSELRTLFWPVPRPLEAVDRWSENERPATGAAATLRPFASAVIPGCLLGFLITRFLVAPRLSDDDSMTAMVWIIAASSAVLGIVFKVVIGAILRKQAARLDDDTALAIVLEQLRHGMTVNAAAVPRACVWIRRNVAALSGKTD